MRETEIIIKSILTSIYKAESIEEIKDAVETLLTEEEVAYVKEKVAKHIKRKI